MYPCLGIFSDFLYPFLASFFFFQNFPGFKSDQCIVREVFSYLKISFKKATQKCGTSPYVIKCEYPEMTGIMNLLQVKIRGLSSEMCKYGVIQWTIRVKKQTVHQVQ